MQRILFWLGVILLANWWWRKQSRAALERMQQRRTQTGATSGMSGTPGGGSSRTRALTAEPMARCAVCEVHLPQSEAIMAGGRYFCGPEHARTAGEQA